MKWYGGASPNGGVVSDHRGDGDSYATPAPSHHPHRHHHHPAQDAALMNTTESVGGETAHTSETEPLLGERLLPPGTDEPPPDRLRLPSPLDPKSLFSPSSTVAVGIGGSDASTIEEVRSAASSSSATRDAPGGRRAPVAPARRRSPRGGGSSPWGGADSADPRVGYDVVTGGGGGEVELDTLAYSRDHDDSTLFTADNFVRRYLSPEGGGVDAGGGGGGGVLIRLSARSLVLCVGLAVGVGLCSAAAIAYNAELTSPPGASESSGAADPSSSSSSSSEGAWFGVPYARIGRESFGDPVSDIMDVSLFHPSLLHRGRILLGGEDGESAAAPRTAVESGNRDRQPPPTNGDDGGRRRLANNDPKPFLRVPFPTGAFWTNLVVLPRNDGRASPSPKEDPDRFSYPIVAYPYSYQWSSLGRLQASYSANRRVSGAKIVQDEFAPDITLGSAEGISSRHVVRFDSLSVTLRFYSGGENPIQKRSWETCIVQGSPYVTAVYSGLTPELRALSDFTDISCPPTLQEGEAAASQQQHPKHDDGSNRRRRRRKLEFSASSNSASTATAGKKLGICDLATDSSTQKKVITGVQFVVTTKEGLTWLVFTSEPITFELDKDAMRSIQSREKYTGVIRLALVPPTSSNAAASMSDGSSATRSLDVGHLSSSSGVKRLIYHAGAYPVGGTVSWDFRSGTRYPLATSTSSSISANKAHSRRAMEQNVTRHRMTTDAPKDNNIGTITFSFDTNHMTASSPSTDVPLLMLALPHHAASISSAEALLLRPDDFDLFYHSIKGRMVPVVGNTWSYEEELTFIGFGDDPTPTSSLSTTGASAPSQRSSIHEFTAISALDQSIRDLILETVESDLKVNLPDLSGGAYSFGKQIARLAQLAHIAGAIDAANIIEVDAEVDRIKNDTENDLIQIPISSSMLPPLDMASSETRGRESRRAFALLEKYLTMWFGGRSEERLVYDAQLGGILSKVGTEDINADFGNARYNDHHFHYGYVLFASAILGRANPQFVSQYGPFVDALFYDVAHNGVANEEIFFPLARHKSWFDGHSFASGLFPFADGKSQESSSEAVNCYYGAYLWSKVRWGGKGDRKIVDYARLLLATEMTGAKTYWHMMPPQDGKSGGAADGTLASTGGAVPVAYDPIFRGNYMVGNLGMTDVTCTTWFGTENIYVHLINFLPVTPITSELFDKGYVRGERSVLSSNDSLEIAWKGYSICNEAIIHPNSAWAEAQNLVSTQLDPGISKSQVLFWVSTREDFSSATTAKASPKNNHGEQEIPAHPINGDSISLASCSSHLNCLAANLEGSCCPTSNGIMLNCCS